MWSERAQAAISNALKALPNDASPEAKKAAIDAAYPFGPREFWPYKVWLKERRKAFWLLGIATKVPAPVHLSPLERAKAKALSA